MWKDAAAFESMLRGQIMNPDMMRGYVNDPKHWMFPVAEAFHEFVLARPRDSVSGVLQVAVGRYYARRPHRSLDLDAPNGPIGGQAPPLHRRIVARSVLGGLHHEYEWLVA